jgi:hypothetical protein
VDDVRPWVNPAGSGLKDGKAPLRAKYGGEQ